MTQVSTWCARGHESQSIILDKQKKNTVSNVYTTATSKYHSETRFPGVLRLPAERFRHTRIPHILVCGKAFDKHCDHLYRNMLDEAGQSNGWIKGGV